MGIDVHLGDHYFVLHVPTPVLILAALIALGGAWKAAQLIWAALPH